MLVDADPASAANLGQVVDAYKELRDVRLAMEKETELVASAERRFKEHLVQSLSKSDEAGVFGLKYKAKHTTKRIPKVMDEGWGKLYSFIQQTGRFDLLQRRLGDKAVMEMIEAGETVPGVETMLVSDISVTKV
jgi:hypothetical protein